MTFKKGYKQTKEHKEKIGLSNSISLKGKHCSPKTEFKKGNIPSNKGKPMEEEIKQKISGINSPFWNGGSKSYYMKIARATILKEEKDTSQCQICKDKTKTFIHHYDGNIKNNAIRNLGVICNFCHNAIHDNPNKIKNRFQIGHLPYKHN